MRFFKPTAAFWPWIKAEFHHRRIPVIDCGCGSGDLVREMNAAGVAALGIDPRFDWFNESVPLDLAARVIAQEAQHSSIVKGTPAILLTCRPCHTGFPVEISHAMHPDSVLYYVGFDRNIAFDLGTARRSLLEAGIVGEDGERIWKVHHPRHARRVKAELQAA